MLPQAMATNAARRERGLVFINEMEQRENRIGRINLNGGISDVTYAERHTSPGKFRCSDQPDANHRQQRRGVPGVLVIANDERRQRWRERKKRRKIVQPGCSRPKIHTRCAVNRLRRPMLLHGGAARLVRAAAHRALHFRAIPVGHFHRTRNRENLCREKQAYRERENERSFGEHCDPLDRDLISTFPPFANTKTIFDRPMADPFP
jgi:hypothetical protein